MEKLCEVCGNERPADRVKCHYCGHRSPESPGNLQKTQSHRVVNIEQGKPLVEEALSRLERALEAARGEGVRVVTIIHGYGSSGKGGTIRSECRRTLEFLVAKKRIRDFIPGENFSKRQGQTRALLRRIPSMQNSDNLNRANRGVTIVEI